MVPEGGVLDGVLSSQGNAAEQDEEEDQIGEDRVIDNAVALEAKPAGKEKGGRESCQKGKERSSLGLRSPRSSLQRTEGQFGGWMLQPKVLLLLDNDSHNPAPTTRHVCTELCHSKALLLTADF